MTYGSYNPGARYRQRSQRRMVSLLTTFLFLLLFFGLGYWIGVLSTGQNIYILQQQKEDAEQRAEQLQNDLTQARADAQTADIRLEQVKASYNEILSEGPMQEMVVMLKKQVEAGVDPARLQSVILSARPPKNCSEPQSKRFLIVTPVYSGPESRISIESGLIAITGMGESAKNDKNEKEAWFDPAKPVQIEFYPSGGKKSMKEGTLPLYYSLPIGDKEYRFTIAPDTKSFAKVTYDFCDYP